VNGSVKEGRKMVQDFSKLMLRAFNAEADTLVRGLKPYKLDSAIERLSKVEETIKRLGTTMQIRISPAYFQLRVNEIQLTADFLQKQAEEKELERLERERMREERKAQQEIERERAKLEKEKQHYINALEALQVRGDQEGIQRIQEQLAEVAHAIESVDARAANIRAGYVYVISNIGSFGESIVKVGMTRRLDPMDRIRELSDASVPFNFDVHALFFSNDAVGIELAMHERLAGLRVNTVNRRREFFLVTPLEVKAHLSELTGELLEFHEMAEALEYRQTLRGVVPPKAAKPSAQQQFSTRPR
jgi:vacuolar-type H+-ATPase subunit I/STV1